MRCKCGNFNSLSYSWGSQKKERNANATHCFALGQCTSTNKSLRKGINNFIKLPDNVCTSCPAPRRCCLKGPTSIFETWNVITHHLRMFVQARTLKSERSPSGQIHTKTHYWEDIQSIIGFGGIKESMCCWGHACLLYIWCVSEYMLVKGWRTQHCRRAAARCIDCTFRQFSIRF